MAAMSNYLENELVDHLFRQRSFAAPTAIHVALFTAAPSDTGGGTEVTGGSYARVALAPLFSNWKGTGGEVTAADSAGTTGTTSNNATITFAAPTANWGLVTHFALFDASSGGNMFFYGALTQSKNVNNGDAAPSFAVDALSIQLDN
jgi:hypothetical protein